MDDSRLQQAEAELVDALECLAEILEEIPDKAGDATLLRRACSAINDAIYCVEFVREP